MDVRVNGNEVLNVHIASVGYRVRLRPLRQGRVRG
jgi:hypothetical protein